MGYSEDEGAAIPAADSGDIDLIALARTHPAEAAEITRIEELMNRGAESHEEFLRLCQLVKDFGSFQDAEYLLRRNIDSDHEEADIERYFELFGTGKWDEFTLSIDCFERQLRLTLEDPEIHQFMVTSYLSAGSPVAGKVCGLLASPCQITIEYTHRNLIIADIMPEDAVEDDLWSEDRRKAMAFRGGRWIAASREVLE